MAFANIWQWLKTAASNSSLNGIALGENVMLPSGVNNAFREFMSQIATVESKGTDVASATTLALGTERYYHVTGTTTITDIDFTDAVDGRWAWLIFDGALTLTHNATTLKLPGGANITTAAGDRALFVQDATDNVICLVYQRASDLASFSPGHLSGLTLSNNGTDATNDIDIAAGSARDSTDVANIVLASAITKRLDAAWAVGSGNGGRDTGSIADGTWHVHLIKRPDTGVVDVLFSLSATAPTLPTNYTVFRRIGSIIRESAAIVGFIQKGDRFDRLVAAGDVNAVNPGSSAVTASLSVPGGISVEAVLSFMVKDDTPASATALLLTALDVTDSTALVSSRFHAAIANAGATTPQYGVGQCIMRTNTSGQVRYRLNASDADITVRIVTHGWVDDRGRTE